jgi:sugar O-acyltransferase (sialic acid O-acetyltransferase NeuD family)
MSQNSQHTAGPSADSRKDTQRLGIFGAGGHAKVVADIAESTGSFTVFAFYDDNESRHQSSFYGATIRGGQPTFLTDLGEGVIDTAIIAVGNNGFRSKLGQSIREQRLSLATLVHPDAVISPSASLASGTVVMAGVVVNASTLVGHDVILNTGCTIDHDCFIGDGAHIAPGVSLCGGVSVGNRTLIGVGASAKPSVSIGSSSTIGAGSAVIEDIGDNMTAVGVPAKVISNKQKEQQ